MITLSKALIKKNTVNDIRPRVKFFGAKIDPLTMEETLTCVDRIIENRTPVQHVVVNVAKVIMMFSDMELRKAVNSCSLINADGQGIVWGARLLGLNVPERVAGIDLFIKIVERAPAKKHRIYLLGAKQDILEKVVETFNKKYPGITFAGFRNGYWTPAEEEKVVQDIRDSRADCLFVAMPSPKKEFFLNKHLAAMNVPFVMGVGGSFDVVAGYVKRAPLWMQKAGLEWFYRFISEPGRMWKRYLTTNAVFVGMLAKVMMTRKGKR